MNIATEIVADWHKFKGAVQENWGKITNNEFDQIAGHKEKLIGTVMKKYELTKENAERAVNQFLNQPK